MRGTEVALQPLLDVLALAVADQHHAPPVQRAQAGDDRTIVTVEAVTGQFHPVGTQFLDVV
jgi:hypothetical protein